MSSFANNAKLNEQNASSPSNTKKATSHSSVKKAKSLSREFFSQLIKLEADFHNKAYTVSTLDELIQNYAKAVEYYDSIKDEISSYFMFKIQDILATKRSLKMLFDQNRVAARKGTESVAEKEGEISHVPNAQAQQSESPSVQKDIKKDIIEESSGDEDEDMQISKVERKRKARKNVDRNMRVSISLMKNEKQRFFNFYYKMETQKPNEKLNMNVLIDNFEKSADKNDEFVKKDVDHQRERLRKRLEKRVTENFASHQRSSMSPSVSNNAALASWEERRELEQTEMIRQSIIENWENEGAKIMEVENSDIESDHEDDDSGNHKNDIGEKSPANNEDEDDSSPDVL